MPGKEHTRPGRMGRPSIAEAATLSERILEEAVRLFFDQGFRATSVDMVADAAGVTKRTLYARYRSKAVLFEAAVSATIDVRLDALALLMPADGDIRSRLVSVCTLLLDWLLTDRSVGMYRVVSAESRQFPALARNIHSHGARRAAGLIGDVLHEGVRKGEIEIDDIGFAADYLTAAVIQYPFQQAVLGLVAARLDDATRHHIDQAVELFLAGTLPRGRWAGQP
ncbi:TetR/AcrR family transcriptional regulator [Komagataeibacter oboediens]|nr:TetR/AcrR family transcriptional regulator [Komagataeibacter oboediens]MCK9820475.1 TetR/AcrR family transcriptional regulator [Komagataeibacter oboediens]